MTGDKKDAARMARALNRQGAVQKPTWPGKGCWARVRDRSGTGSARSKYMGGNFYSCGNRPRPGFLTCHAHAALEHDAQDLKSELDKRKD